MRPGKQFVRFGVDEVRGEIDYEAPPFDNPASFVIQLPQTLHGTHHQLPPQVGSGEIQRVEEIGFLGGEVTEPVALAGFNLHPTVVSGRRHGRIGANDVQRAGLVGGSVRLVEEIGEVPRQCHGRGGEWCSRGHPRA